MFAQQRLLEAVELREADAMIVRMGGSKFVKKAEKRMMVNSRGKRRGYMRNKAF